MKKLFLLTIFILLAAFSANAQTECPENMVCISREAAIRANQALDENPALKDEIKALKEARAADEAAINKLKVETARMSGENSQLKQQQVRDAALIELLVKMVRPKQNGLINIKF